ncbi:winged helix-turn-helix transcriptional regulator [Streptomyces sp. Ag109_O5-1]|uniref:winged helix-turn-helix transcriptional regulator n=1 Tax=Streptomyces sp. Ag109_O5-1 TaxID=1938851 RepID=UPI00162A5B79|nr:winged helix-turn-helix transcriptional regulator [Streptomyces sp. Ag109_O5-1]
MTDHGIEFDSRLVRLWLTDAGRALQKPVGEERRRMEEAVTADLTEVERQHLLSALTKINRAANGLLEGPDPEDR